MNKYFECVIIATLSFILIEITKKIFSNINKSKKIHLTFLKSIIQAGIVIIAIFLIGSKFDLFRELSASLITGSTLIVAVVAFSLEEGITNLVHGFIISVCKPFNIGDRLNLINQNITGTVEDITLRHTVLKNVLTGTYVLIPNTILDKEIIENSYYEKTKYSHYVDISISRDADIEKAREIFKNIIISDNTVIGDKNNIYIYVRDISDDAIWLRGFIETNTLSDNFIACSEIRRKLLIEYQQQGINQPHGYHVVKN